MNWNHCMDPLDNDHPFKIQLGKDKMRHFCIWRHVKRVWIRFILEIKWIESETQLIHIRIKAVILYNNQKGMLNSMKANPSEKDSY